MPTFTHVASRATSTHASRASSLAREIVKRREKPYKTEKKRVLARRKKLELHVRLFFLVRSLPTDME